MQGKTKTRQRKPAESRRQDIIEAAMEIIRHEGVDKLTTRSLSKAVGIAQATLFLHFGDKKHVLLALIETVQGKLQDGLRSLELEKLSPLARLETVIRFHLKFIERQPGIPRLLFSEELQARDQILRDRLNQMVEFFLLFLTRQIKEGQASGEIRAELEAEACACLLIASIQGLAFRWILSEQRFVLAEQADVVVATFFKGWAAKSEVAK